jgi:hypothetical protein
MKQVLSPLQSSIRGRNTVLFDLGQGLRCRGEACLQARRGRALWEAACLEEEGDLHLSVLLLAEEDLPQVGWRQRGR